MDEEYQRMAANSIAHEAFCAGQAWQQAAAAQERPCVLWKPALFRDGNQWCALLGENIQDGVIGFGDSPDAAMWAFDEAWREKLPLAPGAQPAPSVPDGVAEALQRLIENGAVLGPSSSEDALLVARYRQHLLSSAPSISPAALRPVIQWLRNGCDPMKAAKELEILIVATPEAKP